MVRESGLPYVIENVPGAALRKPLVLCGSMFNLGVNGRQLRRHRLFETSFEVPDLACQHSGPVVGVYGSGGGGAMTRGYKGTADEYREAMEMPWATKAEIAQAVPPSYTAYIGSYLRIALDQEANERERAMVTA
jgi:DNA (cytosine-5)-methyltransferase 1